MKSGLCVTEIMSLHLSFQWCNICDVDKYITRIINIGLSEVAILNMR
jgi:hypothetical protein